MSEIYYTPSDYLNPDWNRDKYMYSDWKRFVSTPLQAIWQDFTPEQRRVLAECFEDMT
jgi:hypothetical protein